MSRWMLKPLQSENPIERAAGLAIRITDLYDTLRTVLPEGCGLHREEPLAKRTTLRVGGPADLLIEPDSENSLRVAIELCGQLEVPWCVIGRGSNLVVRDGGVRGAVFVLSHPFFCRIESQPGRIYAGAGVRLKAIAVAARQAGIGGMEFLEGIPGSLGGALRMNAGAMGRWTFDAVERLRYLSAEGEILDVEGTTVQADYRNCPLLRRGVALAAILRGELADPETVRGKMDAYSKKRWASQPNQPSAGCTFKNPSATLPAGRLIDELGLKSLSVGGARVSDVHANFLVNDGSATARDVLQLMDLVRNRVREQKGIELHPEVEIIGEDKP